MPENPLVTAEVVEEVKKGITTIGALSKENKDAIGSLTEQFRAIEKKQGDVDPITQERLDKLAGDLSTRQEAIDTAIAKAAKDAEDINKRMDEVEVAAKRIGKRGSSGDIEQDRKNIEEFMGFQRSVAANQAKTLNWRQIRALEKEPDFDTLNEYKDAFKEYLYVDDKLISSESAKALQVGVDVDGGYTVTPFMSNRISERLFETDPIRQLASIETIGTDAFEMFMDTDEAGADWEGERVQNANVTTPKMNKKRIPVHILATHPKITQMLLDDSNINIESWLANKVADKFSRTEAAAFVTGNGVGQPTGFGTYGDWDTAGTYKHGAIERTNMGHATQFTTDGLIDVKYSMIEQYLMRGTWLTNRLNVRDIMKLKDGDGQYIWRPGITEGQPAMLLGLPFRMSTTVATAAAAALAIYLADWRESYLIVDRQGINVQRDPYTSKPFVEFYTRKRVGGDVINYQSIKIGVCAV